VDEGRVSGLSRAVKGVLIGVGIVFVVVLVLLWRSNRPGFSEKRIGIGASCLRVQVADTSEERSKGLRDRDGMDGFDGMVFEFPRTMNHAKTRFTMSGVRFPLTIGFYDESGHRVDARDMQPCSGADRQCPSYGSKGDYRTAVETPRGKLPDGPLTACPS